MFSILNRPTRLCDGISRREMLTIGGLGTLGLSLPALLAAKESAAGAAGMAGTFGRAKNVIYLWLQGGPPQHETFDPKPDAPLGNPRAVQADLDQRAGHPVLRAVAAHCAHRRQAGRRPLDVDRRQHARHQRLLGADRLQSIRRQRTREIKPERLALLRLDRQDAQAERARAGAVDACGFPTSCGSTTT